jgi:alpha-beta hydrolase superfamily lysophospholipase
VDSATLATEAVATDGEVTSADGTHLFYRGWPRAQATHTFAVVHGLGEHSGRYEAFAQAMRKRGMATYAVDLRGHGKSQGQRGHVDSWSQWTDDVASFVARVESLTSGEVIPVGHSFGGVAMLSTVLADQLKNARRFIVSSPALKLKVTVPQWKVSLSKVTSRLTPRLALANEVDAGTVSRIPEVVEAYRTDPLVHAKISSRLYTEWHSAADDVLAHADRIAIPFLILAGDADQLVDPAGSEQLHAKASRQSTLRMLPGRYHEPFNDLGSEEVFDIIASWIST